MNVVGNGLLEGNPGDSSVFETASYESGAGWGLSSVHIPAGAEKKLLDGQSLGKLRKSRLEGLLGCGHNDSLKPFWTYAAAFGMLPYDRHNPVHTHLYGLFYEPLVSVNILRGADGHSETVGVVSPAGNGGFGCSGHFPW